MVQLPKENQVSQKKKERGHETIKIEEGRGGHGTLSAATPVTSRGSVGVDVGESALRHGEN